MAKLISIGQIIDQTWDNYSDNFKNWMKISSIFFVVTIIWLVGAFLSPQANVDFLIEQGLISPLQDFGIKLGAITTLILFPIAYLWTTIGLIKEADNFAQKKKESIKAIYSYTLKKFFPFLGLSILKTLILASSLIAMVPGFILILINVNTSGSTLLGIISLLTMFLGNIGAIILLILLGVMLAFPSFELIAGKQGIIQSLKGSVKIVKGRFWSTLVRLLVPKILISVVIIALDILLRLLLLTLLSGIRPDQLFLQGLSYTISNLAFTGIIVLSAPLWVIADYIIYDSLRKNR